MRPAAFRPDRVDHRLRHGPVRTAAVARPAEIVDHDRGTLAREQPGVGFAKPTARAGDDRDLAVEQTHGVLRFAQARTVLPFLMTVTPRLFTRPSIEITLPSFQRSNDTVSPGNTGAEKRVTCCRNASGS